MNNTVNFINLIVEGPLENGNNILHMAGIKGQTDFIKNAIRLSYASEEIVNLINLPNSDGLSVLHLYYKYGGHDKDLLKNKYICYLDVNNKSLANYIISKIDLFELFIDQMIQNKCIENLNLDPDINITIIDIFHKEKNDRYEKILMKMIDHGVSYTNVVYYSIYLNEIGILDKILKRKLNLSIKNKREKTPLMFAVYYGKYEIVEKLLDHSMKNEREYMINYGGKKNNDRPINIAITRSDFKMIRLLLDKLHQTNDSFKLDQTDQYQNTYLHNFIKLIGNNKINGIHDILKIFINVTDLNQENYAGTTSLHLLFQTGLWKEVVDVLIHKKLDLLKVDEFGNNIYSYIKDDDTELFMKIPHNIVISVDKSKSVIKRKSKKNNQSYSVFNSDMIHNMIYMKYLMDKHTDLLYIPYRPMDEPNKDFELFVESMTSYSIDPAHSTMNRLTKIMNSLFYCYTPHYIIWKSKTHYFIHHDLKEILQQFEEKRYILIKITLIIDDEIIHANMFMFDVEKKIGRRFEPMGVSDIIDGKELDRVLGDLFSEVFGEIKYIEPDQYLQGLNFQLTSADDDPSNKNLGDPYGYCLAWCLWFIDLRLTYPDYDDIELVHNFFRKTRDPILTSTVFVESDLSSLESEVNGSDNYYLDFIRIYAKMLDEKKNKIMIEMGIDKNDIYNIYPKNEVLDIISKRLSQPL